MGVSTLRSHPKMTVDEFHAFVESLHGDDRKWQLIDGVPIVNASPIRLHQMIVVNIAAALNEFGRASGAPWVAIPGTNVVAPDDLYNAPEPDVLVVPAANWEAWKAMDGLCVFEVISRSTRAIDLRRKPEIYARSPSILDYVVVSQSRLEVLHYCRSGGWRADRLAGADDVVHLESIGADLSLAQIYARTPLSRR